MANFKNMEQEQFEEQFEERVIEIARVAKVVKGGRRFQFRVTVVTGDKRGNIGMGVGKANAVPDAMRKASERARKDLRTVNLAGTTIPHEILGKVAGARPLLVLVLSLLVVYALFWKLLAYVISSLNLWEAPMC